VKRVAWWSAWWLVLFWLWLALAGEWNRIEWIAAAIAATVAATIAEIVRAQHDLRFSFRVAWLRELAAVPLQIAVDVGIVFAALLRSPRGRFVTRQTGPRGTGRVEAGRAAFLTIAATYSPNAYVVDVDRENGTVQLHDLVENRGSETPA
jgi:hypothetical protein